MSCFQIRKSEPAVGHRWWLCWFLGSRGGWRVKINRSPAASLFKVLAWSHVPTTLSAMQATQL